MILVKDKFSLLKNTENILSIDERTENFYHEKADAYVSEIYDYLKVHEKNIIHPYKKKIIDLISIPDEKNIFKIVEFTNYLLPITINKETNKILINLKYFNTQDITKISAKSLYSVLVYGYSFYRLSQNEINVKEAFSSPIINFYLSLFMRLYGKKYGLLGIYSTEISKLKFLIACYIYSSYFGMDIDKKNMYKNAFSISLFRYDEIENELNNFNFSDIRQFIKSLSYFDVMPGIDTYGFASVILKMLGLNFIPAIEDASRFISLILGSNIKGTNIFPSFISKYNENEFRKFLFIEKLIFSQ